MGGGPIWMRAVAFTLVLASAGCSADGGTGASTEAPDGDPAATAFPLPTPTSSSSQEYPEGSAMRALRADGRFSTFAAILERYDIGRGLELWSNPAHDATIFAPTDAAFRRVPPELLPAVMDALVMPRVVRHHVAEEPLRSADLAALDEVQTLGVALAITHTSDGLSVGGVRLVGLDLEAGPTIIHVLDEVLLPCHDAYLVDVLGPPFADHCSA